MTAGIVRAPSPGAWDEGETLLMSLSEGSSPMSQLQVLDDVRECHTQGRTGPGPVVHYLHHHFLAVINPAESNPEWF